MPSYRRVPVRSLNVIETEDVLATHSLMPARMSTTVRYASSGLASANSAKPFETALRACSSLGDKSSRRIACACHYNFTASET